MPADPSLDHLIRPLQERRRYCEAEVLLRLISGSNEGHVSTRGGQPGYFSPQTTIADPFKRVLPPAGL
jgi:hypothetical protein